MTRKETKKRSQIHPLFSSFEQDYDLSRNSSIGSAVARTIYLRLGGKPIRYPIIFLSSLLLVDAPSRDRPKCILYLSQVVTSWITNVSFQSRFSSRDSRPSPILLFPFTCFYESVSWQFMIRKIESFLVVLHVPESISTDDAMRNISIKLLCWSLYGNFISYDQQFKQAPNIATLHCVSIIEHGGIGYPSKPHTTSRINSFTDLSTILN